MSKIYTLDSNFLIDATRRHFPIEEKEYTVFWEWLAFLGKNGTVAVAQAVYEEIGKGNDKLAQWLKEHKGSFVHDRKSYIKYFSEVMVVYGKGENDEVTLDKLKADPHVIAHAIAIKGVVVTGEIPNKATAPHNKKISSVCIDLGIPYCTLSRFMWEVRATMPP